MNKKAFLSCQSTDFHLMWELIVVGSKNYNENRVKPYIIRSSILVVSDYFSNYHRATSLVTASSSVQSSYYWLTIVQSSLSTSCHIKHPSGHVQFNIQHPFEWKQYPENVFFMFHVRSKWCILLFGCAPSLFLLLGTASLARLLCFHPEHISLFHNTSLKEDVLRAFAVGLNNTVTQSVKKECFETPLSFFVCLYTDMKIITIRLRFTRCFVKLSGMECFPVLTGEKVNIRCGKEVIHDCCVRALSQPSIISKLICFWNFAFGFNKIIFGIEHNVVWSVC